jgi:hypothetical protein
MPHETWAGPYSGETYPVALFETMFLMAGGSLLGDRWADTYAKLTGVGWVMDGDYLRHGKGGAEYALVRLDYIIWCREYIER